MKKKENVCVFYLIIIIFEGEIDIRERNIGVCGDAYMQGEKLFNIYIIKCEFYTLIYAPRLNRATTFFYTHTLSQYFLRFRVRRLSFFLLFLRLLFVLLLFTGSSL